MSNYIFVSYANKDAEFANLVVQSLESRGARCWIASRDIPPGENYGERIVDGIAASRLMVLVLTQHAIASKHVPREVQLAFDGKVRIIPLLVEDVQLDGSLKYYLSTSQLLDVSAHNREKALEVLTAAVRSRAPDLLSSEKDQSGGGVDTAAGAPHSRPVVTDPTGDPDPIDRHVRRAASDVSPSVAETVARSSPAPAPSESLGKKLGKLICLFLFFLALAAAVFQVFDVVDSPDDRTQLGGSTDTLPVW